MDLIGSLPADLKKKAVERSNGIIETDEKCEIHHRYNKSLMPDGEVICPKCYVERNNELVEKTWTQKQYESSAKGRRDYLYNNSILYNKTILEKGLKDFYNRSNAETKVKNEMTIIARKITNGEVMNVFLQGGAGRGKSHLAMATLKNVNELSKDKRCLFANLSKVLELIRASFNNSLEKKDEAYYVNLLGKCDVLVLDDIGAELSLNTAKQASDFTSRVLYSILDAREDKVTIFTSNFSIERLAEVLDERLISRINSNIRLVSFDGVLDKRSQKGELRAMQQDLFNSEQSS